MIYLLLSDVFEISHHNLWIITDQDSVAVLWFNLAAAQHHAAIPVELMGWAKKLFTKIEKGRERENNSSKDSNMMCIYETSAVQRNISVLSTLFFS